MRSIFLDRGTIHWLQWLSRGRGWGTTEVALVTHLSFWCCVPGAFKSFEHVKPNENVTEYATVCFVHCAQFSILSPEVTTPEVVCLLKNSLGICQHCDILSVKKESILVYSSRAFLLLLHKDKHTLTCIHTRSKYRATYYVLLLSCLIIWLEELYPYFYTCI